MSTKDVRGRRTSEDDRRALAELLHHRPAPLAAPPQILEKPGLFDDVAEPRRASLRQPAPVEVTRQQRPEAHFTEVAPGSRVSDQSRTPSRRQEGATQRVPRSQPQVQTAHAIPPQNRARVEPASRAEQPSNPQQRSEARASRPGPVGSTRARKIQGDAPVASQRGTFRTGDDDDAPVSPVVPPAVQSAEDLREAGWWDTLMHPSRDWIDEPRKRNILVLIIAVVSVLVILWAYTPLGSSPPWLLPAVPEIDDVQNTRPIPDPEHSVVGMPTIGPNKINRVLASWKSPARDTGPIWIEMGRKYNIDPAYALAFFIHESGAGTNPRWDGMKPDGSTTHNIGNISCAGYPSCLGRWRDYPGWREGIEDWFRLIAVEYVQGRGTQTVAQIIPIYAPSFENDVNHYVQTVERLVDKWRSEEGR